MVHERRESPESPQPGFPPGLKLMPGSVSWKTGAVFGARPHNLRTVAPGELPAEPERRPARVTTLEMPYVMTEEVAAIWRETVANLESLGLAHAADQRAVASYCELSAEVEDLSRQIDRLSRRRGAASDTTLSKLRRERRQAQTLLNRLYGQLGLAPSARARLVKDTEWRPPAGLDDGLNPFAGHGLRPRRDLYEGDD
jgi:phage terminase small subunit